MLVLRVLPEEIRRFLFVAFSAFAHCPARILGTAKRRDLHILRSSQLLSLG